MLGPLYKWLRIWAAIVSNARTATHVAYTQYFNVWNYSDAQICAIAQACCQPRPLPPPPGVIAFDFLVTFDGVYVLGGGAINKLPSNWFYFFHFCLGSFDFARHRAKPSKHTHLRHPEWRSQICENYRSISRHKREKRWNIKTIAKPLQSHIIQMPEINQT